MTTSTSRQRGSARDLLVFALILLVVFLIWLGSWWGINSLISEVPSTESLEATRGQFGDKFGAVNSLFSGLAFAGIIFTILLQRADLNETRKTISHERFDTAFFALLGLHMKITESVETIGSRGKEAFVAFHNVLKGKDADFYAYCALSKIDRDQVRRIIDQRNIVPGTFQNLTDADVNNIKEALDAGVRTLENFLDPDLNLHEAKIIKAYEAAAEQKIDDFAHYFRNLYNILKFIDKSNQVAENEKLHYSKIVRSQLSEAELIVLFYNSIAPVKLPGREALELGYPKMSGLLVKYDILQNMNPRSLIHPDHKKIFEKNNPREMK